MNQYGKAALEAVKLYTEAGAPSPRAAWDRATAVVFGEGTASQKLSWPRDAFLGLCDEGLVRGIPAGHYCQSLLDKQYALSALHQIKIDPGLALRPLRLWQRVMHGADLPHAGQMDVVIALWNFGLIGPPVG